MAHARLLIFVLAMALRSVFGAVFFGSVDVVNSAGNTLGLLSGQTVHLPYFSTIHAFLWLAGVLTNWGMPLPLAIKSVPILFDSLLAVLIRDVVAQTHPDLALRIGLLYAASPLALLNTAFHGQWDAIALFFLVLALAVREVGSEGRRDFLFGTLLCLSILAKPIALPFVLLLPGSGQEFYRRLRLALAGFVAVFAGALAIYAAYGYSAGFAAFHIVFYSAKGVQLFGLPFSPALARLPLEQFRLLWVVPAMAVLATLYYRGRLTAIDAVLLFYLFSLATSGLSPQYLLWPVPILLATRRLRTASLYTLAATSFLLLFYTNPWVTFRDFENAALFAPLRAVQWLQPPVLLSSRALIPLIHLLGNVILPAALGVSAIVVFCTRDCSRSPAAGERWAYSWRWYLAPVVLLAAVILTAQATVDRTALREHFLEIWAAAPDHYAMHIHSSSPVLILAGDAGRSSVFNIVVLLAVLTAGWCAIAAGRVNFGARWARLTAMRHFLSNHN